MDWAIVLSSFDVAILVAILSALVGALAIYRLEVKRRRLELEAKRDVLLWALRDDMARIGAAVAPYSVGSVHYQDLIVLQGPGRLLDGEVLEYRTHSDLIERLHTLNVALTKHNELVRITNLVQNQQGLPDNIHRQMYDLAVDRHSLVVAAKSDILVELSKLLGPNLSQIGDGPD